MLCKDLFCFTTVDFENSFQVLSVRLVNIIVLLMVLVRKRLA